MRINNLIEKTALNEGYTEIVKLFLANGADINVKNNDGNTALMHAAMNGHPEMVLVLLDAGANLAVADNEGKTSLMIAQEQGNAEIVTILESVIENRQLLNVLESAITDHSTPGLNF